VYEYAQQSLTPSEGEPIGSLLIAGWSCGCAWRA